MLAIVIDIIIIVSNSVRSWVAVPAAQPNASWFPGLCACIYGLWCETDSDRPAIDKFVDENSEGPEVCSEVVTSVKNDLWSDVFRRPAERPRLVSIVSDVLRETEVNLQQSLSDLDCTSTGVTRYLGKLRSLKNYGLGPSFRSPSSPPFPSPSIIFFLQFLY